MKVWNVEDANRLLMLRQLMRSVAFEIRVGITPVHGFLQVMMSECQDEQERLVLRVIWDRLQAVEQVLKELILLYTQETGERYVTDWEHVLLEDQQTVQRIAEIGNTLSKIHQELLLWQEDDYLYVSSTRLDVMLQGLRLAQKVCREIVELASMHE